MSTNRILILSLLQDERVEAETNFYNGFITFEQLQQNLARLDERLAFLAESGDAIVH